MNNYDREKMKDNLGRMYFQKQRKQCFGISNILKMLDLFAKIIKENDEQTIGSIFS